MKFLPPKKTSRGFTIIELLIATLVFSIVLVVILGTFIQISRLFYKGVNMTNTQEDARIVEQSIASDIQFGSSLPANQTDTVNNQGPGFFCVGLHRYKYRMGYQLNSTTGPSDYVILRDDVSFASGCTAAAPGSNPQELLGTGMQLNALNINCGNGLCRLNFHILFYGGSNDVFTSSENPGNTTAAHMAASQDPDAECTDNPSSSQYCVTADYDSTVLQKV